MSTTASAIRNATTTTPGTSATAIYHANLVKEAEMAKMKADEEAEQKKRDMEKQEKTRQEKNPIEEMAQKFGYETINSLKAKMTIEIFNQLITRANELIKGLKQVTSITKENNNFKINENNKPRDGADLILFNLGRCYHVSIVGIVEKDIERARYCYGLASKWGYIPAKSNLALLLLDNHPEKAVQLLTEVAEQQFVLAYKMLADCFLHNYGVKPHIDNLKKAYHYYRLAFEANIKDADKGVKTCLKYFKHYNITVPADAALPLSLEEELRRRDTLFTHNSPESQYSTAETRQKWTEAQFLLRKNLADTMILDDTSREIALTLANARYDVAQCYFEGLFFDKEDMDKLGDFSEENKITRLAIKAKYIDLAVRYCHEAAIRLDFAPALTLLGDFYRKRACQESKKKAKIEEEGGLYQENDKKRNQEHNSFECYSKAADKGFYKAQYQLALLCQDSNFMQALGLANEEENRNAAFTWALRAAVQGYKEAQNLVTKFYQENYAGIPNDLSPKTLTEQLKSKEEVKAKQEATLSATTVSGSFAKPKAMVSTASAAPAALASASASASASGSASASASASASGSVTRSKAVPTKATASTIHAASIHISGSSPENAPIVQFASQSNTIIPIPCRSDSAVNKELRKSLKGLKSLKRKSSAASISSSNTASTASASGSGSVSATKKTTRSTSGITNPSAETIQSVQVVEKSNKRRK